MNRSTTFRDPYLSNEESNRLQRCIEFRETLGLLASRKPIPLRRSSIYRQSDVRLIIQRGKCNDPGLMRDLIHNVIVRDIFPKMPKEYFSGTCKFHNYQCRCAVTMREMFVMGKLRDLGLDMHKLKPEIDAAFIMTLENEPVSSLILSSLKREVDLTPRRHVPHFIRQRKIPPAANRQSAQRFRGTPPACVPRFPEDPGRVIVEYMPMKTQNARSILKPRRTNTVRRVSGVWKDV